MTNYCTPLKTAIALWKQGCPIPSDLAMQLNTLGYSVEYLENIYLTA